MEAKTFKYDKALTETINVAAQLTSVHRSRYITYEHFLLALCMNKAFICAYEEAGGDTKNLSVDLIDYIKKYVPSSDALEPYPSFFLGAVLKDMGTYAVASNREIISLGIFLKMSLSMTQCFGNYYLAKNMSQDVTEDVFLKKISNYMKTDYIDEDSFAHALKIMYPEESEGNSSKNEPDKSRLWKRFVINVNEEVLNSGTCIIGREKEIAETIEVLLRKEKSNPVHIGEPGVGKTSITYGLAARINAGTVPDRLKNRTIYKCDFNTILENASYQGSIETRLKAIFEGVAKENAILFMDEMQTIFSDTYPVAANSVKPFLTQDNISVIGAITTKDYRKHIEKDSALERRFSPIIVNEPTKKETFEILKGLQAQYEDFHSCIYSDEILKNIIALTEKFIRDRNFPDKAVDIMDIMGAKINAMHVPMSERCVSMDILGTALSSRCNIPKETILKDAEENIRTLPDNMKKIVIGQDNAIDKIAENLLVARAGLRGENKPIASLLFVGPTGVGKTFIAETLAKELNVPIIRKDMSEYSESHSVSKLFGSPAGYVGYDEGGMLVNEIRKNPNSILLFDEIEKAHPIVFDTLLQVMDNAMLTDGLGKKADFRNVIIIMTSNAGAADAEKRTLGFSTEGENNADKMMKEVRLFFKPEFRNRLDAIIQFNPLSRDMAVVIVRNQLGELSDILKENHVEMDIAQNVIDYVVEKGYSKEYGARNIKRIIETDIKVPLSKRLLFGNLKNGGNLKLSVSTANIISIEEAAI